MHCTDTLFLAKMITTNLGTPGIVKQKRTQGTAHFQITGGVSGRAWDVYWCSMLPARRAVQSSSSRPGL